MALQLLAVYELFYENSYKVFEVVTNIDWEGGRRHHESCGKSEEEHSVMKEELPGCKLPTNDYKSLVTGKKLEKEAYEGCAFQIYQPSGRNQITVKPVINTDVRKTSAIRAATFNKK